MATDDNQPSFETAFTELRETVQALEAGNLPLDEATRLFEKGMELAKACNDQLTQTELKITRLQRSYAEAAGISIEPVAEGPPPDAEDEDEDA